MSPLYVEEFDQSKWLNASDIGPVGSEKRVKIKDVTREIDVGKEKQKKACLWLTTLEKGLLLNKTNLRTLQGNFGDKMDDWIGRVIILFVISDFFQGRPTNATRVRIPPPKDGYRAVDAPVVQPKKPSPKSQAKPQSYDESLEDDARFNEAEVEEEVSEN